MELEFKVAGIKLKQEFIVVSNLNRSVILGRDFLVKNKVWILMDLSLIRIHNAYVPLDNDIHVCAISRLNKSVKLKPQTAYLIEAKLKKNPYFDQNMECVVDKIDRGFLYDQPELEVTPIVTKVRKGKFPIQIVNNSNKYIHLRKGCIVGKISQINKNEISINSVDHLTYSQIKKSQENSMKNSCNK